MRADSSGEAVTAVRSWRQLAPADDAATCCCAARSLRLVAAAAAASRMHIGWTGVGASCSEAGAASTSRGGLTSHCACGGGRGAGGGEEGL